MKAGVLAAAVAGYALAVAGAAAKLYGAAASGSKSLFVDGLTCISNLVAGALALKYTIESMKPPDADHPYGHHRLTYFSIAVTVTLYAFVAGVAVWSLLGLSEYSVSSEAPIYAVLGFIFYSAAIALTRRAGPALSAYAAFTVSELIESAVTIASTAIAAAYSYLADYLGALLLTGFIAYEIAENLRTLRDVVADYAPRPLVERVRELIESYNVKLVSLRVRMFAHGVYCGDAVVKVPEREFDKAHSLVDAIEREVERRLGVKLVIHYEPDH